jgi:hypothetical protein
VKSRFIHPPLILVSCGLLLVVACRDNGKPALQTADQGEGGTPATQIKWAGRSLEDEHLVQLEEMRDLQELDLRICKISDKDLKHLRRLTKLRTLWIGGNDISDDGLRQLKDLRNLEALRLNSTKISDNGLTHLSGLSKLRELDLSYTKVTSDGLIKLKELSSLEGIYLTDTLVSDSGMQHLAEMKNLLTVA